MEFRCGSKKVIKQTFVYLANDCIEFKSTLHKNFIFSNELILNKDMLRTVMRYLSISTKLYKIFELILNYLNSNNFKHINIIV